MFFGIAIGSFAAFGVGAAAPLAIVWKTVVDQHGSSVTIPYSALKRVPDPDGLSFQTRDGKASIRVWTTTESRPGFPGNNPKADMDLKRSDCGTGSPTYLEISESVGSYSCVLRGRVSYYLAKYSPSGSVALAISYPTDRRKPWDQYVVLMARSLQQVERHEIK